MCPHKFDDILIFIKVYQPTYSTDALCRADKLLFMACCSCSNGSHFHYTFPWLVTMTTTACFSSYYLLKIWPLVKGWWVYYSSCGFFDAIVGEAHFRVLSADVTTLQHIWDFVLGSECITSVKSVQEIAV